MEFSDRLSTNFLTVRLEFENDERQHFVFALWSTSYGHVLFDEK